MAASWGGCVALMMHVVYKGRALPVARLVRPGTKGHFPEACPCSTTYALVEL
jgi:hypothetical protein